MNRVLSNNVNGVCTSSNNPVNNICPLSDKCIKTDSTDINVFTDSNSVTHNQGKVDSMPIHFNNEECSEQLDPPSISDQNQSIEQLSEWVNDMMSFSHNHGRFDTVINAKWSRSPKVPNRGLTDDPISGHLAFRRALDLDGMFFMISQGCPLQKSYLSHHLTSLKDIWSLVYSHYGNRYNSD